MIKASVLKKQILLGGFGKKDLERISKIIKPLSFRKGEFLFKEKDATKGLYLIHSGKIEISKTTNDGWKQTLAVLGSGHFLGELSIIEHRHHDASALAINNTEVFLITKKEFEEMEKHDADLTSKIMKNLVLVLSGNIRRMNEKFLNSLISY
jgi:CRP-like cAMP-binding protein